MMVFRPAGMVLVRWLDGLMDERVAESTERPLPVLGTNKCSPGRDTEDTSKDMMRQREGQRAKEMLRDGLCYPAYGFRDG